MAARTKWFYVGGIYEDVPEKGVIGQGKVMRGQMYVECLQPVETTKKWPIVMIPGAGQIGTNFLDTPDGRPGWASYFLTQGYCVYIVDQVARGRSAWYPPQEPSEPQQQSLISTEDYAKYFTAPQNFNLWPSAKTYSQWPGTTGLPGDAVFDQLYASQVQFIASADHAEKENQRAGLALLERIGPAIILTHSQSGSFGWAISEVAQPKGLVKGMIALEPSGPPFKDWKSITEKRHSKPYGITSVPLTYKPPISAPSDLQTIVVDPSPGSGRTPCVQQDPAQPGGPRQLPHLHNIPTLVVTSEASYHNQYDYGTVQYLKEAGVDVTWFELAEMGIKGNGHFFFLEKNSNEIAKLVGDWLEANIKQE